MKAYFDQVALDPEVGNNTIRTPEMQCIDILEDSRWLVLLTLTFHFDRRCC